MESQNTEAIYFICYKELEMYNGGELLTWLDFPVCGLRVSIVWP